MIRKQNESNKKIKQKERRQKRENLAAEGIDLGRFSELATSYKNYVNCLNLHENKTEILDDYTGDFGLLGSMLIGEIEQKTNIRFQNVNDFESYVVAIDNTDYDGDDDVFTGRLYKKTHLNLKK